MDPYRPWLDAMGVSNAVAVPWEAGGRILGTVGAYDSTSPGGFTEEDVWVLRIAAVGAGLVWLHKQADDRRAELQAKETGALRRHAQRLSDLERVKAQFLNLAAHELRGPLTVARGYVSMLGEEPQPDAPASLSARLLPVVASKLTEMARLIDQMLETARLEDQELRLHTQPFDLVALVADTVAAIRPDVGALHRLRLVHDTSQALVLGDRARLETVLVNLLDNAFKYSPHGGDVGVRCSVPASGRIVQVSVQDSGLGIADADMARVFTRFGRIVTARTVTSPARALASTSAVSW